MNKRFSLLLSHAFGFAFRFAFCFAFCFEASVCFAQTDVWQDELLGKWKCDAQKTIEAMKGSEKPDADLEMMKEVLPGLELEFAAGVIIIRIDISGFTDETKGTWKVESSDEEKKLIKLEIHMEGEDKKGGEISFLSDTSLQLVTDEGDKMIFNRVKEEEKKDDD